MVKLIKEVIKMIHSFRLVIEEIKKNFSDILITDVPEWWVNMAIDNDYINERDYDLFLSWRKEHIEELQ